MLKQFKLDPGEVFIMKKWRHVLIYHWENTVFLTIWKYCQFSCSVKVKRDLVNWQGPRDSVVKYGSEWKDSKRSVYKNKIQYTVECEDPSIISRNASGTQHSSLTGLNLPQVEVNRLTEWSSVCTVKGILSKIVMLS